MRVLILDRMPLITIRYRIDNEYLLKSSLTFWFGMAFIISLATFLGSLPKRSIAEIPSISASAISLSISLIFKTIVFSSLKKDFESI